MGQKQGTNDDDHGCGVKRRCEAVFEHRREQETGVPVEVLTAASGVELHVVVLSCCSGYEGIQAVALKHVGFGWHSRKETW